MRARASDSSVATIVRWVVVVPWEVTATGVAALRPAPDQRIGRVERCALPAQTTTVVVAAAWVVQSTVVSAGVTTWTARVFAPVSGTPA